jgi:glycosyltransferase involved in cell wall biosynthesis
MDITVIITAYNEIDYISTAIESVIDQNKVPSELLIIDAGSTNGTRSIISKYESNYTFIKSEFIDEEINIPEMRNMALEKARGPLITFLDGDDKFHPRKLEEEYNTYKSHPEANIVFSNVCLVDEDGDMLDIWFENEEPPTGKILAENASRDWPTGSLYRNELISLDLLSEVGMYDEDLTVYEDWDLKIRTAAKTKAAYCPEVLTEYRQHDSGISSRISMSEHHDMSEYIYNKNLNLLMENLDEHQLSETLQSMKKFIFELGIREAKEKQNYKQMLFAYYKWIRISGCQRYDLKKHASLILPEQLKLYFK